MDDETTETQGIVNEFIITESSVITYASKILQAGTDAERRDVVDGYEPDRNPMLIDAVRGIGDAIRQTPLARSRRVSSFYHGFRICCEECTVLTRDVADGRCSPDVLEVAMKRLEGLMDKLPEVIRKAVEESSMERTRSDIPGSHSMGMYPALHQDEEDQQSSTEHQRLLVIGNGFDLNHGLPTRFSDFRDYLKANHPDDLRYIEDNLADGDPDAFWSDVETWLG